MSDLSDQIASLLSDVRSGATKKKKRLVKKQSKKGKLLSTTIEDKTPTKYIDRHPWHDEALVMVATTHRCRYCENEVTSWSPYIYIERARVIKGSLERTQERLPHCDPDITYDSLPRRIEHREYITCRCHLCFGKLPNGFHRHEPRQLTLPFDEPQQQEEIANAYN